jgi:hypothetical protein
VVDLAGRMLLSHVLASQDKKSVYRFSMGAIAGKTASAILFVNVTTGTRKQTEKYVLLGNR